MFDFLKRDKVRRTFAPLGTDMHCHLLPLVDDGSRSLEESLEVMETMASVGYEGIWLTPHFCYPRFPNVEPNIEERFKYFCEEIEANKGDKIIPKIIGLAGEYQIDDGFAGHVDGGRMLTLQRREKGDEKGLLLVELSLHHRRMGVEEAIFERVMDGYEVVLAHPERYPYLDGHSKTLEQLKEQGVLMQVNALSLDGFYGDIAQKRAWEYIERGWVELIGTDMHNLMYAQALRHASLNKKIIKLMENVEFENSKLLK